MNYDSTPALEMSKESTITTKEAVYLNSLMLDLKWATAELYRKDYKSFEDQHELFDAVQRIQVKFHNATKALCTNKTRP